MSFRISQSPVVIVGEIDTGHNVALAFGDGATAANDTSVNIGSNGSGNEAANSFNIEAMQHHHSYWG